MAYAVSLSKDSAKTDLATVASAGERNVREAVYWFVFVMRGLPPCPRHSLFVFVSRCP